ncbi:stage II sporulation protein M [Methanobrevibacter sp.]|uniref:stage II sporulation protein M n=1 Tax=Methanobrevibacter sp. TaxID=66852 RepID=UPI00388F85A1
MRHQKLLKQLYNEVKVAFLENKSAILISFFILFFSLILGYLLAPYLYSYLNPVVDDLTQKVQTGVIQLTFTDIFLNNVWIIIQMFIYGLFLCVSVLILAYNGFFVGYYVAISDNMYKVLAMLIPHGIFELTSCILACSSGLVLFNFLFRFLYKSYLKEDLTLKKSFNKNLYKLKHAIIIFLVSVVLMVIAGFVEAYLTIPIAYFLLGV